MGCGCSGSAPTAYERVWRLTRVGQPPLEHADRNVVEQARRDAGGDGRIERRIRIATR